MALTPISLFQSQGNGIAQFLQGGQNALASALNNVIQVGRDTVNKQFAQERDFLGERQRVEALAQRRGEMAQQQANADRSFARGIFESDRQFADQNADQARQEARQRTMDLFNMEESNREFGLRKSEADRAAAERQRADQFSADILAQPPAAGAAPSRMTPESLFSPVAPAAPGSPLPAPMTGTVPTTAAGSPEERLAQAKIRAAAAQRVGDAAAFTRYSTEAAGLEAEVRRAGGGTEGLTPTQLMSRERLDMAKEDRTLRQQEEAAKKAEEATAATKKTAAAQAKLLVDANPDAFPPASSYVPANLPEKEKEAALAQAEARDANRVAVELQAALESPSPEAYVAKLVQPYKYGKDGWVQKTEQEIADELAKIPQSVKNRRKKFWEDAEKTGAGKRPKPTGASATPAPSGSTDWLDKQLKGL